MRDQFYPLVSIYRVNCPPPDAEVTLIDRDLLKVKFLNGGINLSTSKMKTTFTEDGTASEMISRDHSIESDNYLIIENWFEVPAEDIPYEYRVEAEMESNKIASTVEISERSLISEKVFENVVNTKGRQVAMPKSPTKVTSRPFLKPEDFSQEVKSALEKLESLSGEEEERFRLSSRWFQKGMNEESMVDRFMSWYISLEVYPSKDSTSVKENVRDFLVREVFSNRSPGEVTSKLSLGRITGLRAEIVHNGLSEISKGDPDNPGEFLEIVECIVRVSLKNQLGIGYDGELNEWMEE